MASHLVAGAERALPMVLEKPRLLVVEGQDEADFLAALLRYVRIADCDIIDVGGCTQFKNIFGPLVQRRGFERIEALGVIRDADVSASSAFQSIAGILQQVGLEPPVSAGRFSSGRPRVGVFIMPGTDEPGMLEDLFLRSERAHPAMKCVDHFAACLQELDPARQPKNYAKMRAQAFLAATPLSPASIGVGALQGYWDFHSRELRDLKSFLSEFKQR